MENQSESEKKSPTVEWRKLITFIVFVCGLDTGIHYQFVHNVTQGSQQETQGNLLLDPSHSKSAKILLYSTIIRVLLVFGCLRVCHKKLIPVVIQPHVHYITMTLTFVSCSITMGRFLLDSEPPSDVTYPAYIFLIAIDMALAVGEFFFCKHVIKVSEATADFEKLKKEEEKKTKKDEDDEKEERTVPFHVLMRKLFSWYKSQWLLIGCGYFLLIIGSSASSLESILNSSVIDAINTKNPTDALPGAILMFSLCRLVERAARTSSNFLSRIVSSRVSVTAKSQLYKVLLSQEVGFFDETKSGKILGRLGSVSSDIEDIWRSMERNIESVLCLIGSVTAMMTMSWRLSIIIVLGIYAIWLTNNILRSYYIKRWKRMDKVRTEARSMASEVVRNIRTVKSFANEDLESKKYDEKIHEIFKLSQQDRIAAPILSMIQMITWLSIRATVLLYGGHLLSVGQLTPGQLVSFLLYMGRVWGEFQYLVDWEAQRFWKHLLTLERFFEYIERKPKVDTSGNYTSNELKGRIEFNDVSFQYPSRPESQILKGMSFTVKPGQMVALVGSSGGGKSTCVNLIERFYDPSSGSVTLDLKPIHNYNNKFLHNVISIVAQEPILFGCSIEENIKYGKPDAIHEEVVQAAKDANAHDFITALDDGYETDVGEAGSQMSGGQKQRIAIARALITKPKIMLLDEATSALDAESESLVQDALQRGMKGRTVVVIAHRLSTIEHADKIIVVDKGVVVEQGNHKKLLSSKGVYSKLVRKQMKSAKPMMIEDLLKECSSDGESSQNDSGMTSRVHSDNEEK